MSTAAAAPRLREVAAGVLELIWPSGTVPAAEEVSQLLDQAFADGAHRVEALVAVGDRETRIRLQRAGLRPEGTARGRGQDPTGASVDLTLLARLSDDPPPGTRQSFLAMLNATLPRTRVIAQGLVHDGSGRVLLCELTYKTEWDLPGGVVDPRESPRRALEREVAEELGLALPAQQLRAVNWMPPYRQWDDAVLFVFDLGVVPDLPERARLETRELAEVHWAAPAEFSSRMAPYAVRHLTTVLAADPGAGPIFLEDGAEVSSVSTSGRLDGQ